MLLKIVEMSVLQIRDWSQSSLLSLTHFCSDLIRINNMHHKLLTTESKQNGVEIEKIAKIPNDTLVHSFTQSVGLRMV